eukprot:TRINITY_DN120684_c0_g1_i1.p1 TRINITY_DN120684_c0_g1~~TRINITY_DN120684_c0_g1_i1.p1  ORF type:complete len:1058 (+),score=257.60 TRINITY_DN120684_c0_g1_i1:96-3176(+)
MADASAAADGVKEAEETMRLLLQDSPVNETKAMSKPPGLFGPPGLTNQGYGGSSSSSRPAPPPVPPGNLSVPNGNSTSSAHRPHVPPVPGKAGSAPPGLDQRPPPPPVPAEADDDEEEEEWEEDAPDDEKKGTREPIFPPHLDVVEAEAKWKKKLLVKGTLRVSGARPSSAYVRPEGSKSRDDDILVKGRLNRNRAINGDIVYIELVDADRGRGSEALEEAVEEEEEDDEKPVLPADDDSDEDSDEEVLLGSAIMASGPAVAETNNGSSVTNSKAAKASRAGARNSGGGGDRGNVAKVVAIAEAKGRNRIIVCTLHPNRKVRKNGDDEDDDDASDRTEVLASDKTLKAKPTDKRMPWILLQINDVTRQVLNLPGKLNKFMLWPIQILQWKDGSHLPLGRLQGKCIGEAGDLQAEVKHALIENELDDHDVDFTDDLLEETDGIVAAAKKDFQEQCKKRHDLRKKRIFTIDPATAKDLDDAIHVDFDKDKNEIEIGVHIADVGHFVLPGSVVEDEAKRRTTSVYLINSVLPMLPHGLCNFLCSLNPNEDKVAFSVFFRLDVDTGELVKDREPWFEKTVIRSCCRLNYDEAQDVLDGRDKDWPIDKRPAVYGGWAWKDIKEDLFLLYDVMGKVRRGRMSGGAMTITKTKMIFHVRDSVDGIPTNWHVEDHSASHWIIEELMLYANRVVAAHLANTKFWDCGAILRNHNAPDRKKADILDRLLKNNLNIQEWNSDDAKNLYLSCQRIYKKYGHILGQSIEMMVMRAGMQQAEYICYGAEQNPHHFALNFDYYTHFTSPIRRWPDVMVHRVLKALIFNEEDGFQTGDDAILQVNVCNEKRSRARKCQEQMDRAVFCVYLRARKEWYYTTGTVLSLTEDRKSGADFLTVYCPQLGKEKKVLLCSQADVQRMDLMPVEDDELLLPNTWRFTGRGYLELEWAPEAEGDGSQGRRQKLQVLSSIPVVIIPTMTVPIDFAIFLVSPLHRRFSDIDRDIPDQARQGFEWAEVDEDGVEVVLQPDDTDPAAVVDTLDL